MENNISKMIKKENKIGVFYTCYTEKAAVEFSLDMLFEIYPEIRVYLVSDGGSDYSFLNSKPYGNNLKRVAFAYCGSLWARGHRLSSQQGLIRLYPDLSSVCGPPAGGSQTEKTKNPPRSNPWI
jgi:hypothetical protein